MTGGGFGGCSVTLVEASAIPLLTERLEARFQAELDSTPGIFTTRAREGVREHGS
jgi:galactokinase